jgi:UDP-3-O-[3-hydroxymyristoyl] N-acetylglucosamine deacetylase
LAPGIKTQGEPVVAISPAHQHTVAGPAIFAGVGLHSGDRVRAVILPAPVDAGILFVRTDLAGCKPIAAKADRVVDARMNTAIANPSGVAVATVEHLMAALFALGIDNALVELDGAEVPAMDGSAVPFVEMIDRAGRRRQEAPRQYLQVLEPVEVADGEKRASLAPAPRFELALEIDFESDAIGRQSLDIVLDEAGFRGELADCRTFGFMHEVVALRRSGLARGGSLDNAVVIDGDKILNPGGLRREGEFVRHKALDAVGDLALLGHPLLGRFEGRCSGHALNNALARALLANPSAWRLTTLSADLAEAV